MNRVLEQADFGQAIRAWVDARAAVSYSSANVVISVPSVPFPRLVNLGFRYNKDGGPKEGDRMICPRCGATVLESRRACGECGSPMPWKCSACGSVTPPDRRVCRGCGAAVGRPPHRPPRLPPECCPSGGC